MRSLMPDIDQKRKDGVSVRIYAVRRWLRISGVRPGLYILSLAVMAWFFASQVDFRPVQQKVLSLGDRLLWLAMEATEAKIQLGEVRGNRHTTREEIAQALGLPRMISWITLDTQELRDRVEALPWVARASVRMDLPDQIDIFVVEQTAEAVWHSEGEPWLLTASGERIAHMEDRSESLDLPVLFGDGASEAVGEILALRATQPVLLQEFLWFRRIGQRRWNGRLNSGATIAFPESNLTAAADRLVAINRRLHLLERDVTRIDLRHGHRVAIRYRGKDLERFLEFMRQVSDSGRGA